MEYEYRELSKEKIEKLNEKRFVNMYGTVEKFGGGAECVTTPDEGIVFTQIGQSHENYIPSEFFLNYSAWYFYIYLYEEYRGSNKNSIGKDYYTYDRIERIENATFDKARDEAPSEEEILKVLKEILPVWNRNNGGRLNPGDQIITTGIEYKGVLL